MSIPQFSAKPVLEESPQEDCESDCSFYSVFKSKTIKLDPESRQGYAVGVLAIDSSRQSPPDHRLCPKSVSLYLRDICE